ncbi:MAG TPA: hemagglutinin protein, partial [Flavobacteriales bacterium]|nr:hemagglutinin protein [Flavobacteriales bacterium]
GVLAVTGSNAIVDWVIVELRSTATPTTVVASCAALVQRDGDVVALDGTSPVSIAVASGAYHVAIRHRNHLGVMTQNGVALSNTPSTVDFTSVATSTYGTNARKSMAGAFPAQALWAGDVTFNGQVKYTGGGNDRDPVLTTVGSATPGNTVNAYSTRDVNLNGQVKYTGSSNDRDPILLNVGSATPNNIRSAQLP